jgi:uncharacterized protein VirK/YbjX
MGIYLLLALPPVLAAIFRISRAHLRNTFGVNQQDPATLADAHFRFAVARVDARVFVRHDPSGRTTCENAAMPLIREDVIQCYKTILKRDPENEEVVQGHLSVAQSVWDLIESFVNSEELRVRTIDSRATRNDVIECYKRILKREPESEGVIQHHLSGRLSHWDLVGRLVDSVEHKNSILMSSALSQTKSIHRKYLAKSIEGRDKYICFSQNYIYLSEKISSKAFDLMLFYDIRLFEWSLGQSVYTVDLQFNREFDNEGEMLLQFRLGGISSPLYSVAFSIVPGHVLGSIKDGYVLLISRMQGAVGGFEEIRLATKDMGEISPHAVLVAALQGIGEAIDVRTGAGVCAVNQLSYNQSEAELFDRVYDRFFRSIGATGPNNGFYLFDIPLPEKPIGPGHRGRKQLKREFKKEISKTVCMSWHNTVALNRSKEVSARVSEEFERQ